MIYHIPFPFPVTFPIHIFGAEEVVSILDFILILVLGLSSIYGFFKGFLPKFFRCSHGLLQFQWRMHLEDNLKLSFSQYLHQRY